MIVGLVAYPPPPMLDIAVPLRPAPGVIIGESACPGVMKMPACGAGSLPSSLGTTRLKWMRTEFNRVGVMMRVVESVISLEFKLSVCRKPGNPEDVSLDETD